MHQNGNRGITQPNSFLKEVASAVRWRDIVLILAIPALMIVINNAPRQFQRGLYLDYGNASVLALWSSAFVHRGVQHLTNNLSAYSLVIMIIYLLLALSGRQRLFRYTFLSFLLVVPPIVGLANIVVIGQGSGAGFSGVGSAFFGFLPLAIFVFAKSLISEVVEETYSVVLFLIVAGGIAVIYKRFVIGGIAFLLSGILIAAYAHRIGLSELQYVVSELMSNSGCLMLVIFATLLSVVTPLMLFPEKLANNGNTVNIFSHYIGLCLGYFGPMIYLHFR